MKSPRDFLEALPVNATPVQFRTYATPFLEDEGYALLARKMKVSRTEPLVEDTIQEIHALIIKKDAFCRKILEKESRSGYLLRCVFNQYNTFLRQRKASLERGKRYSEIQELKRDEPSLPDKSIQDIQEIEKIVKILASTIQELPPKQRETFILRHVEGRSNAEASKILGVALDTVKKYAPAATRKVKARLTPYYEAWCKSGSNPPPFMEALKKALHENQNIIS